MSWVHRNGECSEISTHFPSRSRSQKKLQVNANGEGETKSKHRVLCECNCCRCNSFIGQCRPTVQAEFNSNVKLNVQRNCNSTAQAKSKSTLALVGNSKSKSNAILIKLLSEPTVAAPEHPRDSCALGTLRARMLNVLDVYAHIFPPTHI